MGILHLCLADNGNPKSLLKSSSDEILLKLDLYFSVPLKDLYQISSHH